LEASDDPAERGKESTSRADSRQQRTPGRMGGIAARGSSLFS